jgi:hypothetical protein
MIGDVDALRSQRTIYLHLVPRPHDSRLFSHQIAGLLERHADYLFEHLQPPVATPVTETKITVVASLICSVMLFGRLAVCYVSVESNITPVCRDIFLNIIARLSSRISYIVTVASDHNNLEWAALQYDLLSEAWLRFWIHMFINKRVLESLT